MSTKCQAKPKNVIPQKKQNQGNNDIIEIKDIPIAKQAKANQKNKENIENISSEDTTPNKKRQNKKKKDSELIEIMDIEIPDGEFSFGKKKGSAPPPKQNKTPNKEIENDKHKKKGKSSNKSVSKLTTKDKDKDKSPANRKKKEGKVASITLEESDDDCEMEEIKEVKNGTLKKKNTSKTPHKKTVHKENDKNNRNKKPEKKKKKSEKEEEIIQCQLSEESENEDSKDKLQKKRKNKKNSQNSGYLTSRKISKNSLTSMEENENIKSKSTIKVSRKDEAMKEKMNTLLGRKRKADNKNPKSKTPNQKNNKNKNPKEKPADKNKEGKVKSKTPDKKEQKKSDKNNKLNIPKMDIDEENTNEVLSTPELAILNQLTTEYGLEKVIDTICKPKLNQKNKLDSCIQGLRDSCAKDKLPFLLIKMLYSYFDSKNNDNNRNITKRSTSAKKTNILKNINDNLAPENSSKSPGKGQKSKSGSSKMENAEGGNPVSTADEEIQEIQKDKSKKNNTCQEKSKSNNKKSPFKEEKHKEKKTMSIGSHYNKTSEGEIYKYQVSNLDGKGSAIFKCYDDRCNAMGIYELDSKKFSVVKKHNLKHADHEYIKNLDKDADNVFKNLALNEKCNAQVFKENGERTVNIY